jgi:CheY-like chemotaxis protein
MASELKVLIADDEPDIRMLLAIALEAIPNTLVQEASNGREAVHAAREMQPDVIVLDAIMPGMSGPAAVPALREASPESTIVLFSAISSSQLEEFGRSLGIDVYPKTRIPDLIARITDMAQSA